MERRASHCGEAVADPVRKEKALEAERDPRTARIIGAAIEVHRHLGPGLLESAYEECLCWELTRAGVPFQRQVPLPVTYKDIHLDVEYRMDVLVDGAIVLEVKAVDTILPIHEAQLLTYLRLSGARTGLLLNFNAVRLRDGITRMVL